MILENGVVRSMDPSLPASRALAIAGAYVAGGVGVHETALASPDVVDLGGRCVLPGFTDSHVHFPTWSLAQRQVKLDGCASLDEALARIDEADGRSRPVAARLRLARRRLESPHRADQGGARRGHRGDADDHDLEGLPLGLAQLRRAGVRERRSRRRGRRRRARRAGRADGRPPRGVGLALPRPVRAHDGGGVGRGDARRDQARELARSRGDPRQGRLARRAGDLPAGPRGRESLAARLGLDPARAARRRRRRSDSARASATSSSGSATSSASWTARSAPRPRS